MATYLHSMNRSEVHTGPSEPHDMRLVAEHVWIYEFQGSKRAERELIDAEIICDSALTCQITAGSWYFLRFCVGNSAGVETPNWPSPGPHISEFVGSKLNVSRVNANSQMCKKFMKCSSQT